MVPRTITKFETCSICGLPVENLDYDREERDSMGLQDEKGHLQFHKWEDCARHLRERLVEAEDLLLVIINAAIRPVDWQDGVWECSSCGQKGTNKKTIKHVDHCWVQRAQEFNKQTEEEPK